MTNDEVKLVHILCDAGYSKDEVFAAAAIARQDGLTKNLIRYLSKKKKHDFKDVLEFLSPGITTFERENS